MFYLHLRQGFLPSEGQALSNTISNDVRDKVYHTLITAGLYGPTLKKYVAIGWGLRINQ